MKLNEYPPELVSSIAGYQLNGGKVNSISVNPKNKNDVIVVTEYGGLWKTDNGGGRWMHLDNLPAVRAIDVGYADDGRTVIATLERDNSVNNGGGIWISSDGGQNWSRPNTAIPPKNERIPLRISAYGISYAPDKPGTVYVGTDYGVATSNDYGENWSHEMMRVTERLTGNKKQNTVFSILALPGDKVIAFCTGFMFLKQAGVWYVIDGYEGPSGEHPPLGNVDFWPTDSDKLLTLSYSGRYLGLYDIGVSKWTPVSLSSRSITVRFIRILRSVRKGSFDIFVGTNVNLLRASCPDIEALKKLKAEDWTPYGGSLGIHGDCMYLEADNNRDPILLGSSAGLFKPETAEAFFWTSAAGYESGLNSYKITDLAGINLPSMAIGECSASLFINVEDHGMWGSSDYGSSWPYHLATAGFSLQSIKDARSVSDITVAYGSNELGKDISMFANATLEKPRPIPDDDSAGTGISLAPMSEAFSISQNNWIRYKLPVLNAGPDICISQNNGLSWTKKGNVNLEKMGGFTISGDISDPIVYAPFRGTRIRTDIEGGGSIIGLIRFNKLFGPDSRNYDDAVLKYLPKNGSLGLRSIGDHSDTVFGINPKDPNHIIAPDIYNQEIIVSTNGGDSWEIDNNVTNEVTKYGRFLLYDNDPNHMQVTQISFDPYSESRILVGTRDAGIIITENGGKTWSTVPDSEKITYITNFFFTHNNTVIISSYGRGLWELDLSIRHKFPFELYCRGGDCRIRLPFDPHPPIYEKKDWIDKDVIIFLNGRINGLTIVQNQLKKITVTQGTTFKRYPSKSRDPQKLEIIETDNGLGFEGLAGCLAAIQHGEIIKGIVMERNGIFGIISGKEEFNEIPN